MGVWGWKFEGVWGQEFGGVGLGVEFGGRGLGVGVLGHYNIFLRFGFILNDFFLKSLIFPKF